MKGDIGSSGSRVTNIWATTIDVGTIIVTTLTSSTAGNFSDYLNTNTFHATGTATFAGAINASTTLDLTGAARFQSTLNVIGVSTLAGFTFTNATGTGNLTVNSLNITNGDEYRLHTANVSIINPTSTIHSTGTITISFPVAATIIGVECYSRQAGTSTIALDRRASSTPATAGDSVMVGLGCGAATSTVTFASSTMTAGSILNFTVTSVGSPSSTHAAIIYRNND